MDPLISITGRVSEDGVQPSPSREGLKALRDKIRVNEKGTGIELIGEVGISSHFGDVLRQAQVPSFIKRKK